MAILTTFITSIVLRDRKDAKMQAEIQPEKQI